MSPACGSSGSYVAAALAGFVVGSFVDLFVRPLLGWVARWWPL